MLPSVHKLNAIAFWVNACQVAIHLCEKFDLGMLYQTQRRIYLPLYIYMWVVENLKQNTWNSVYRKECFPSKESDTKDFTEYIFRVQGGHHQVVFQLGCIYKWGRGRCGERRLIGFS